MSIQNIEHLETDHIPFELGPLHPLLPVPLKVFLELDGETIVSCKVETGFLRRGLARLIENATWRQGTVWVGRMDSETGVFYELAYAMAAEKIAAIRVSKRSQYIRMILCEMNRLTNHLRYMAKLAQVIGATSAFHYLMRDRERILELFELLSGARFNYNFIKIGGVAQDVSEGFVERTIEVCEGLQHRLNEYNELLTLNYFFIERLGFTGVVFPDQAHRYSVSGPNLRACGVNQDLRKSAPYLRYDDLVFTVPVGAGQYSVPGDSHQRFLMRLSELDQSLSLLKQAAEQIPAGEFDAFFEKDIHVPKGSAAIAIEGPRGEIICELSSSGGPQPEKIRFKTPSQGVLSLLTEVLKGANLSDLPSVLCSLDISISEVDQ